MSGLGNWNPVNIMGWGEKNILRPGVEFLDRIDPMAGVVKAITGMKDSPGISMMNETDRGLASPAAQTLLPIAGGIAGGIFGGPWGATGGSALGSEIAGYKAGMPQDERERRSATSGILAGAGSWLGGQAADWLSGSGETATAASTPTPASEYPSWYTEGTSPHAGGVPAAQNPFYEIPADSGVGAGGGAGATPSVISPQNEAVTPAPMAGTTALDYATMPSYDFSGGSAFSPEASSPIFPPSGGGGEGWGYGAPNTSGYENFTNIYDPNLLLAEEEATRQSPMIGMFDKPGAGGWRASPTFAPNTLETGATTGNKGMVGNAWDWMGANKGKTALGGMALLNVINSMNQANMAQGVNEAQQRSYNDYLSAINPPPSVRQSRYQESLGNIAATSKNARQNVLNTMAARGVRGRGMAAPTGDLAEAERQSRNQAYNQAFGTWAAPGSPGPANYAPGAGNLALGGATNAANYLLPLLMYQNLYGKGGGM